MAARQGKQRSLPVTKTIEFFFDYGSSTSYLAHGQLPALAATAMAVSARRGC